MKITILGSGTCVPRLERACSALLVEAEGVNILIDCGLGTIHRLLEAGKDPSDIDLLFLTHFHPDHTGELVSLLFSGKYAGKYGRKKSLTLVAGKGLSDFYQGLCGIYGEWVDLSGLLRIKELSLPGDSLWDFNGLKLSFAPACHRPESLAIGVESCGRKMVFTGDTDVCPNLVSFAKGAELFICEAAMPDDMKVPGHLTPSLAGAMAEEAGVRHLVLTHFYPECDEVDMVATAGKTFHGPVTMAEDLMVMDLSSV
ncbi:MBL fold metallo-hydrolase [Desulfobotulus mexicanus]|nr:ribonuclease Z [Desulfobotulus mexicanus]